MCRRSASSSGNNILSLMHAQAREAEAGSSFQLTEAFSRFGEVESVTIRVKDAETHGPDKSWAFVCFEEESAAAECLDADDIWSVFYC